MKANPWLMNKKIKIAIYSGEVPSTTFIERLINGLSKMGHHIYIFGAQTQKVNYTGNVTLATYKKGRIPKLLHLAKYSLLLHLFKNRERKKLDGMLGKVSKNLLYSKVKYYPILWHKPDIFHLQWAKGLEEWKWVLEFDMKLVLSLRGAHINYSPIADPELVLMYNRCFPLVDGFHAVSKAIGKEAETYGASYDKIRVVYSGLKLNDFKTSKVLKIETFQMISIGRPHWVKGYNYALDACKILKTKNFNFKYIIVGGSKDLELMYQIQDLGLKDYVVLMDKISFEDVKRLVESSHLLILPSVKEGIPNVVLEAMALGTLVLATDCGGIDEVISDGKNGFIVPIRDSRKMADCILNISHLTKIEISNIEKEAKKTLKKQHLENQMLKDMNSFYQDVLNGKAESKNLYD